MLTTAIPTDWKDLQNKVAEIFRECGFIVEIEKTIQSARGQVEIDVYAEEEIRGRKYVLLCECKHWQSRVPQSTIHGFRTIVGDIGAHKGFIISTSGFQAGSFTASDLTNIELLTWENFRTAFEDTWLERYFLPTIAERLHALIDCVSPSGPDWAEKGSESDFQDLRELRARYMSFGMLALRLAYWPEWNKHQRGSLQLAPKLPLESCFDDQRLLQNLPREIVQATAYREFCNLCLEYGEAAIQEFHAIRDRIKVASGAN